MAFDKYLVVNFCLASHLLRETVEWNTHWMAWRSDNQHLKHQPNWSCISIYPVILYLCILTDKLSHLGLEHHRLKHLITRTSIIVHNITTTSTQFSFIMKWPILIAFLLNTTPCTTDATLVYTSLLYRQPYTGHPICYIHTHIYRTHWSATVLVSNSGILLSASSLNSVHNDINVKEITK